MLIDRKIHIKQNMSLYKTFEESVYMTRVEAMRTFPFTFGRKEEKHKMQKEFIGCTSCSLVDNTIQT